MADIADDVYPNDSETLGIYAPEEEQDEAQTAELHQMASSYPIMDELIKWFDAWIADEKTTDTIDVNDTMTDAQIARQVMVNKRIAFRIESKRNELDGKFTAYKQAMNPQPGDNDE